MLLPFEDRNLWANPEMDAVTWGVWTPKAVESLAPELYRAYLAARLQALMEALPQKEVRRMLWLERIDLPPFPKAWGDDLVAMLRLEDRVPMRQAQENLALISDPSLRKEAEGVDLENWLATAIPSMIRE